MISLYEHWPKGQVFWSDLGPHHSSPSEREDERKDKPYHDECCHTTYHTNQDWVCKDFGKAK